MVIKRQKYRQELSDFMDLFTVKMTSMRLNYGGGNYRQCVIDIYFAMENINKYILAAKGFFPATHDGVEKLLSNHFIRSGDVSKAVYNNLTNLYLRRKDADYSGAIPFDKADVDEYAQWLENCYREVSGYFQDTDRHLVEGMLKEALDLTRPVSKHGVRPGR